MDCCILFYEAAGLFQIRLIHHSDLVLTYFLCVIRMTPMLLLISSLLISTPADESNTFVDAPCLRIRPIACFSVLSIVA
jgi:hypothetical protein